MTITNLVTEKEYRSHPAVSQTELGWLDISPSYYKAQKDNRTDKDYAAFIIGGAVDTILTDPLSFDQRYYVSDIDSVSTELHKFIKLYVAEMLRSGNKELAIQMAYSESGYKASLKTVMNYFEEPKAQKIISVYTNAAGRKVISKADMLTINCVVRSIRESKFAKMFTPSGIPEIEHYYQFPCFWTHTTVVDGETVEVPCKGLLDLLIIDHTSKTINPYDLKTTGKSVLDFPLSFIEFKYYLQAAMYMEGLQKTKEIKDLLDAGYVLNNFKFIVAEKACRIPPIEWVVPSTLLRQASVHGFVDRKGVFHKSLDALLEDFAWYSKRNQWTIPRSVIEQDYTLTLDIV